MKTDIKTQMDAPTADETLAQLEAKYPLAAARGSAAGVESEIITEGCPDCLNGDTPYYDGEGNEHMECCVTCGGKGYIEKAKPQPNDGAETRHTKP